MLLKPLWALVALSMKQRNWSRIKLTLSANGLDNSTLPLADRDNT